MTYGLLRRNINKTIINTTTLNMKRVKLTLGLLAVIMVLTSVSSFAQGRYGADSANCVTALNFYKDYYNNKQYDAAATIWRKAFSSCPPKVSQNLLIHGRKIYQYLIKKHTNNPEYRKQLVDTLMLVHKVRSENFPKYRVTVKENIAYDMLSYWMGEEADIFYAIDDYIKHAGEKVKPALIVAYMTKAKEMYQAKKLSDEEVLKIYSDLSPILEKIISVNPSEENLAARQGFENAFITSGVATCDNLVTVFTPRFEANPTDIATVKQIAIILTKNECVDTDLFLKAVTAQHQLEPSYNSAYGLYKLNGAKDNDEVAMQYMQEAIDSPESDDLKDGELLLEMATFMFKNMEANAKAFQLSKMAAEKNPAVAGKAYFLAASIWANQNCGGDDIDKRAKYWVAVDYLTKAKNADASLAEEADNLIRGYRQYFPKTEDAFMYNLVDGNPYTISCGGLSASTTVRTTK